MNLNLLICAAGLLAAGCVRNLTGNLVRQDGEFYHLKLTTPSCNSGTISAASPTTGEQFTGGYSASPADSGLTFQSGSGTINTFGVRSHYDYDGMGSYRSLVSIGHGHLMNSNGVDIEFEIRINPGNPPRGYGRGIDNSNRTYKLVF